MSNTNINILKNQQLLPIVVNTSVKKDGEGREVYETGEQKNNPDHHVARLFLYSSTSFMKHSTEILGLTKLAEIFSKVEA